MSETLLLRVTSPPPQDEERVDNGYRGTGRRRIMYTIANRVLMGASN